MKALRKAKQRLGCTKTVGKPADDAADNKMVHDGVPYIGILLPKTHVSGIDYVCAVGLLATCFVLFANGDIEYIGWNSLNYLFGNPLDFYANAARYQPVGADYPPSLYAIFALWLYPWKLLGVITGPEVFPSYLVYWLKALTTLVYLGASYSFFLIAKEYFSDLDRARYATAVWVTAPLALFSQFIFSQTDIFHVSLMLVGYLMFVRNRTVSASAWFGVAITFKYFPAFVFVPLLLLHEKRPSRVLTCMMIFFSPTLLIHLIYLNSTLFTDNPILQPQIDRIYAVSFTTGWIRVYLLPLIFMALCGGAYFRRPVPESRLREAAYVWLIASILPFLFVSWYPQWLIFTVPAIVLTSLIAGNTKQYMHFDLVGMIFFVAASSLIFANNVDARLFRADLLGVPFHNSYLMGGLFEWFGDHSPGVFLTAFTGYLLLQIALKSWASLRGSAPDMWVGVDYGHIRQRLYVGLLIFLVPAGFAIVKDMTGDNVLIWSGWPPPFGGRVELTRNRVIEQSVAMEGSAIASIGLVISTFGRDGADDVTVEVVDSAGRSLGKVTRLIGATRETWWHEFGFGSKPVNCSDRCAFRVSSSKGAAASAFSLLSSAGDTYKRGESVIDGQAQGNDLVFRVTFVR